MFCGGFGRGFAGWGFGAMQSSFGFMSVMMLFRFLFFIAFIFLAVKLYKKHMVSSRSAIKILDERFAKGELSEEDYIKRKAMLS